jgi:agmatine/peptidylarginine deiminase
MLARCQVLNPLWTLLLFPCLALANVAAIAGPWPEFAVTDTLVVSSELFSAPYRGEELAAAVQSTGVGWYVIKPNGPLTHSQMWIRDFAPQWSSDGKTVYDFKFTDPPPRYGDGFPRKIAIHRKLSTQQVDIELDGGDIQTDGEFCFTSSSDPKAVPALRGMGCLSVIIVRDPPHAHLDMWMKVVAPRTILISEIDEMTLKRAVSWYGGIPDDLLQLKLRLDQIASDFRKTFHVYRIPQPLPFRNTFRNFANSILLNGTAIIPTYRDFGWSNLPYPDGDLNKYYEDLVQKVYTRAGFKVVFINADSLILNGGAWHCVTMHIPTQRKD